MIVKRLMADGFELIAVKGSHHKFRRADRTVIVPHPKRDLPARHCAQHCADGWMDLKVSMQYFYALVDQNGDSAFGVRFPDLPGCFSAADAIEDVLPNACEALELWFEDCELVPPQPLDRVREAAAEDIAAGAFIVAVPYIKRTGRQVRANISLDKGMLDAIDRAAAERSLTRSAFLADAARNEIEMRR